MENNLNTPPSTPVRSPYKTPPRTLPRTSDIAPPAPKKPRGLFETPKNLGVFRGF